MICKGFGFAAASHFFGKQPSKKPNATMPNIHGLHSNARDSSDSEGEAENRYVGGIGAQGGGRCVSWYFLPAQYIFGIVMCRADGIAIGGVAWNPIEDTAARRCGKLIWVPSFAVWNLFQSEVVR